MTETVITVSSGGQQQQQPKPADNLSWLQFNVNYFTTYPGIIKIVQLVSQQEHLQDRQGNLCGCLAVSVASCAGSPPVMISGIESDLVIVPIRVRDSMTNTYLL